MMLGVGATLMRPLIVVIIGIASRHDRVLRGTLGCEQLGGLRAREGKAQASALYLFFYYMGASVAGSVGGFFWTAYAWPGVAAFLGVLLLVAFAIARHVAQPRGSVMRNVLPCSSLSLERQCSAARLDRGLRNRETEAAAGQHRRTRNRRERIDRRCDHARPAGMPGPRSITSTIARAVDSPTRMTMPVPAGRT